MSNKETILKEGDVVIIPGNNEPLVVTIPEVFLKNNPEFKVLYNINDIVNGRESSRN